MLKYLLIVLIVVFGVLQLLAKKPNTGNMVLFGENTTRMQPPADNVVRVFMDKNGDYYPPQIFIDDRQLYKAGGTLAGWYRQYPDSFNRICKQFGVTGTDDAGAMMRELNQQICRYYANIINRQNNKQPVMLIHGFRKRAYTKPDLFTYLASTDNEILRETLSKMTPLRNNFYIEIYWDACYFSPGKALKDEGFIIFRDKALPNANKAGVSLRPLVEMLENPRLDIVSHSLGARVACNMLYNIPGTSTSYPTPQNKHIKACFIAPAVGSEIFKDFYNRTPNTPPRPDNYEVCIVYNHYDYILRKEGRILGITFTNRTATAFANTSLGCDYQGDIQRMQDMFSSQFGYTKKPLFVDVTKGKKMTNHLVKNYCTNSKFGAVNAFFE